MDKNTPPPLPLIGLIKMSKPSGVRTRSQHQSEPEEEHADLEIATSVRAAEQFEGEIQPSAGANNETRDEYQSQSQAPGAETPTATSVEDNMQTLAQLLLKTNETLNKKLDQRAQIQAQQTQKLDHQAQAQAQQTQKLDLKLDQKAKALDMKLDQQFS